MLVFTELLQEHNLKSVTRVTSVTEWLLCMCYACAMLCYAILGLCIWTDHQQSWHPDYQQLGLGKAVTVVESLSC